MNRLFCLFCLVSWNPTFSQSYAPAAGQPGSTAIHMDSSIIVSWGTTLTVSRGLANNSFPGAGYVTYGEINVGLGPADGVSVISLGDGGIALYEFTQGIQDGPGPDFAIFENGFTDDYMELAFVEVSSDGVNFVRFPSISETPVDFQLNNFSFSDCRYVHNLAGKYRAEYGTPFDLTELNDSLLDLSAIHWVRIVDVVGSIDALYGTFDSQGNIINDPWPTEFESGGFDLDAIAVINQTPLLVNESNLEFTVYPNPCNQYFQIDFEGVFEFEITDVFGATVKRDVGFNKKIVSTQDWNSGVYFLRLYSGEEAIIRRIKVD